jgi:hypothetical protein
MKSNTSSSPDVKAFPRIAEQHFEKLPKRWQIIGTRTRACGCLQFTTGMANAANDQVRKHAAMASRLD